MRGVHQRRTFVRVLAALLASSFLSPLWAAPGDITQVPAPTLGSDPPKARDLNDGDASVATQTGALTYSYPITVPPGRMGMQPSLALAYSSQSPIYGGIAAGWSLSIPEIRLDTSTSVLEQRYFGGGFFDADSWRRQRFISTMAGSRPLIEVTEPVDTDVLAAYRAQNDSTFARYERMPDAATYRWRLRSTDGVVRYFGDVSLALESSKRWAPLTREVDAYGNTVEYQWEGTDIVEIRYTSNPSANLDHFAEVTFDRVAGSCIDVIGRQEDARLGIVRGTRKLAKIRARVFDGTGTRHTREITLAYDPARESCTAKHGPMRVLQSIQESAWGSGASAEPRVDLPAVTFEYNRPERTFDELHQPDWGDLWPDDVLSNNLSWGIRRPGDQWPSIEGMLLDFDGDGLQDRLYVVPDGNDCKFNWRKNLGRQANGEIAFADSGMVAQTLPRLNWALGQKGSTEWCSLSAQLTMATNIPAPAQPECPGTTGTYLAYRWLDMNGDALPDLVTAIHHDPQWFDPNATAWFGPWPACEGPTDGECPLLDSACMDAAFACPDVDQTCTLLGADVATCVAEAPRSSCGTRVSARSLGATNGCLDACDEQPWAGTLQECMIFPTQCEERCASLCSGGDTVAPPPSPPGGSGLACETKTPHQACGRYPWMIYENRGGFLSTTATIKYQPVQLESDNGDSSFGGGSLSSTRHAIDDLDGDGDLDVIVRDRSPDLGGSVNWWQLFLGDGDGNFTQFAGEHPYVWPVPPRAPVSLACTSLPGATCTAIAIAAVQTDNFDVRGLATIADLNGDGAGDLLWKHAPDQFDETLVRPPVWRPVGDADPIHYYRNNGLQFEFVGSMAAPEAPRLNQYQPEIEHLSRSFYDSTANLGLFSTTGTRTSMARLVDIDSDGRPDLIEAGRKGGMWESPSLFVNEGGYFLNPITLDATWRARLAQQTRAFPTTFGDPTRAYAWETTKDLMDLDGDGLPEAWDFTGSTPAYYTDSDTQPLRLLKRIRNGRGGTVDIEYAASTDAAVVTQDAAYPNRKAMPKTQWVVSAMTVSDQWDGDVSETSYKYLHPVWREDDEQRWDFRGFEQVETTRPSGARQVDTYGFQPDWSGRLERSVTYAAVEDEGGAGPRTITETTWESRSLFNSKLWTFHPTVTRSWTCNNGQTEAQCQAANAGLVKKVSVWAPVAAGTGPQQAFIEQQVYTQDSEVFDDGDRRTFEVYTLHANATQYQLKQSVHAALTLIGGVHTWTDYQTWEYDAAYRHPVRHTQYVQVNGAGSPDVATRAITAWEYEATGVQRNVQRPSHFPSGPKEHYAYDPTQRFVTSTTNELGHVVTADHSPGTGAQRWQRGPNTASCGTGCTNAEQTWTDVDGLGRPIASYVNRGADGVPWVKTLVGRTTYTDAVVGGERSKVVSEALIDHAPLPERWTREETQLDGQGRPKRISVRTDSAIDAVTTFEYDHRGHVVEVSLPDPSVDTGATVLYTYAFDSLGRPTAMRRPPVGGDESGVDMFYDGLVHRAEEVTGGLGGPLAHKVLVHDAFGRLAEVREYTDVAAGTYAATHYQYDARDAVARIQNPENVVTELRHDFVGRRTRIDRAGRTWSYTYWPDGQMQSETVPGPIGTSTTTFAYDAIGRASSRVVATRGMSGADLTLFGIGTTSFGYDTCTNGVGRLCTTTHPNGRLGVSHEYDAEGNLVRQARTFDFGGVTGTRDTTATFGPGGRLVSQTYADNAVGQTTRTEARYAYDARANPQTLAWVAPGAAPRNLAVQTRNVAGLVTSRVANLAGVASGWRDFASDWTYDPLTRVTSQIITDSTNAQHAAQELDYFGLDDPSSLRHWMGAVAYDFTFAYDPRHQLTGVTEAAGKFAASYGFTTSGKLAAANVNAAAQPGGTVVARDVAYAYASDVDPEAPSALTVAGGPNLRSYTYDVVGNMIDVRAGNPTAAPTDTFLYDGEDQLRRATKWDATTTPATITGTEEYFYDHGGQRAGVVTRDAAGTVSGVRVFLGDTELELNSLGELTRAYAHLSLGTPVARIESPKGGWAPGASTTATTRIELQYHGLSSNTLVSVNPNGTVESGFVYSPYGELIETTGATTAAQRRRFNDKFRDDLTGLQYYGFRYYDGLVLGWTQADPLYRFAPDAAWAKPRLGNLYQFVLGNPVRYMDPDGRQPVGTGGWNSEHSARNRELYGCGTCHKNDVSMTVEERRGFAKGLRFLASAASLHPKTRPIGIGLDIVADLIDPDPPALSRPGIKIAPGGGGGGGTPPAPPPTKARAPAQGDIDVPDSAVVVRGGAGPAPRPGEVVSGAFGPTVGDAAQGVPHGQIRVTTAGEIRASGGTVTYKPETTRSGTVNNKHVNICIGNACFGDPVPNPVPKKDRVQ